MTHPGATAANLQNAKICYKHDKDPASCISTNTTAATE